LFYLEPLPGMQENKTVSSTKTLNLRICATVVVKLICEETIWCYW